MSLTKQLWLAILIVTTLAIAGAFLVSTITAQRYFSQQLHVKNIDNATSLALSMSQMPKDNITVELQLAAQFDAGHYRLIRLTGPQGETIVERQNDGLSSLDVPDWFIGLVPLGAEAGVAQVQDGWTQFGTLTLESDARYAYIALWEGTKQLLIWMLAAALTTCLIGTMLLKLILRPLGDVVNQARAIGGRRFITIEEPSTTEFRSLVRAMNAMSGRVRDMVAEESRRVDVLRKQAQIDAVSGLYNRETFLNMVDAALGKQDRHATGCLVILRVADLDKLNEQLGRDATDALLKRVGDALGHQAEKHAGWCAGRLNGADFAVLAAGEEEPLQVAQDLEGEVRMILDSEETHEEHPLPVGAVRYVSGSQRASLLSRADAALMASEEADEISVGTETISVAGDLPTNQREWREALETALHRRELQLGDYPVVSATGEAMHYEAPVRLKINDKWRTAGEFIPWAHRLGMMTQLDALVAELAIEQIKTHGRQVSINLSPESLAEPDFHDALDGILSTSPAAAKRLWIEAPEYGALSHLGQYRTLCLALKRYGCRFGLKHVGPHFSRIGELHDIGLDHVKVDASIIRDIDKSPGNQAFLRGLCMVSHAIGMLTIAEGVSSREEMDCLPELGIDGMTGPAVPSDTD